MEFHLVQRNLRYTFEVKQKTPDNQGLFLRGLFRIRTGVDGFADRCLAARPRDHLRNANL